MVSLAAVTAEVILEVVLRVIPRSDGGILVPLSLRGGVKVYSIKC
jgi:hypothetical protein